jgi:hypothetical protein
MGETAGLLSAGAALLQHRLALAVLKRIFALALNHNKLGDPRKSRG